MRELVFPQIDFRLVRSVMETPILDERKWAKTPTIPADAFILDLEDSVVPTMKETARTTALRWFRETEFFGNRLVLARPNNLATRWGRDDIVAFAEAGVQLMLYPKAASADELRDVRALLAEHGATPLIFPIIETAGAVLEVAEIAQLPGIGGLFTGIGDLSVDAGIAFHDAQGKISPALNHAREQVVLAAAAAGVASTDTVFAQNFQDPDDVRSAVITGRDRGFTSMVTFYPPHVDVINQHMRANQSEIEEAVALVQHYEQGQAAGKPAVVLPNGKVAMLLDYIRALRVIEFKSHSIPTMKDLS